MEFTATTIALALLCIGLPTFAAAAKGHSALLFLAGGIVGFLLFGPLAFIVFMIVALALPSSSGRMKSTHGYSQRR